MVTEHENTPSAPAQRRVFNGWARSMAIGSVALVALGGLGLAAARSDALGESSGRFGMGGGHHMRHGGERGGLGFGERRLERILEEIDATPEQAEQVKTIVTAARSDLMPMVADFRGAHDDIAALLSAPTIDRAAAEKLRSERIAKVDAASKRLTAAILDAAAILTPEQRTELAERFQERRGRGRW